MTTQTETAERRFIGSELRVIEEEGKPAVIEGYAAVYGKETDSRMFFTEIIEKGAFDKVVKGKPDVRALRDHNPSLLLGRTSAGTLELVADKRGLLSRITLPDTTAGRDVLESIKRRDITGQSFAFNGKDRWEGDENGKETRFITEVTNLYDVGPVTYPAYPDTTIATRSLEDFRKPALDAAGELERMNMRIRTAE